jgi:hypothetical protein
MRQTAQIISETETATRPLDLVIPYTDHDLTACAIAAAEKMGDGLGEAIRVLYLEPVPYTTELWRPRVNLDFLRDRLQALPSSRPIHSEIVLTRDEDEELLRRLHSDSVVVLASRPRVWRTSQERLAARIRNAGFRVVLVYEDKK